MLRSNATALVTFLAMTRQVVVAMILVTLLLFAPSLALFGTLDTVGGTATAALVTFLATT